ncbi:PREDICTED: alpha-tocopherol transfer protein-like isoform X2 [Polistes dominula]|uniref:Alpha-tocopherol transfer protein-like isoform X2 n=1 Tax=Polistes dominula TaxID=743375 RepID=A0ABM1I1H2_POLDO|nr:PREDICTED: alpha-tocopherol transfer protein-like isoform X2 [Polistes dominula]
MSCSMEKENDQSKELRDEYHSQTKSDDDSKDDLSNNLVKNTKLELNALIKKAETLPKLIAYGEETQLILSCNDEYKKKAETELRETPEVVAESLKIIRELVKGESDLFVPDLDEFFARFLRPCKWYPKSAFRLMQRYYRFRINYPYIMENMAITSLKKTFDSELFMPCPIRSVKGCRIFIIHAGSKWKPKEHYIYDIFKCLIILLEGAITEPHTQIAGIEIIFDMNGLPFSHVPHITPRFAAMLAEFTQRCLPIRLKNVHIVNQPFIFNMVYAVFKPFLSEKLRNRIHFHGTNMTKLISMVGEKALPKEYGGSDLVFTPIGETLWQYFYSWNDEYEELFQYGYRKKNENK